MKLNLNIIKSEFARNILTLMTGTTISQALPVAITPILTRIFTPDDFGVFALFLAITAIVGSISNGQYEQAIVLPKEDIDGLSLVVLGILIAFGLSIILLIIVIFFRSQIADLLGNNGIKPLLFLIPFSTFALGVYNSLTYFNIRKKKFKNVTISMVGRSTSLGFFQVFLGLLTQGPFGLILGQIISYFFGNIILFKTIKQSFNKLRITKKQVKKQALHYKKFPLFSLPSILLNSINLNIINFLITSIYSIKILGFYSLTQRIVGIPARVIGNSFSQVYFQQASLEYLNIGNTKRIFEKTLKKLVIISVPVFIILFFIAEPVFSFVFGREWMISGTYVKILIPLAAVRFVASSLSVTINIFQKQQIMLIVNILFFTTTLLIFLIGNIYNFEFKFILLVYSILMSLEYLFLLFICWRISKNDLFIDFT